MTLEEAIARAEQDVLVMERNGGQFAPLAVARIVDEIAKAAVPFTSWLSESDAMLRSGKGVDFFRSRFAGWAQRGLAEKRGRVRYYREIIVPVREAHAA